MSLVRWAQLKSQLVCLGITSCQMHGKSGRGDTNNTRMVST